MRSLVPGRHDDYDDRLRYLPPLLRIRPMAAILLPTASTPLAERGLYPIRMTLALVGLILFATHILLFVWLEQGMFIGLAVASFLLTSVATAALRRGSGKLALALGWAVVLPYVAFLHVSYGVSVGALLFAFPIAVAGYLVYSNEDWAWRLLPTTFALACWAVIAGHFELSPRVLLSPLDQHIMLTLHGAGSLYAVFVLASHATVFRQAAEQSIADERDRADRLLLNILPGPIAARLLEEPGTIADSFEEVSVVFADLVGFTSLASRLSGTELVEMLNELFSAFDQLAERHGLEKIKTIGDAYMVVGGVPEPIADPAEPAFRMAFDMQAAVTSYAKSSGHPLAVRIGIHVGPVTAGVIGMKKFTYDLWGDTVNVASRMESSGEPGRIHVSQAVHERLQIALCLR